jgi:hypothetical protein
MTNFFGFAKKTAIFCSFLQMLVICCIRIANLLYILLWLIYKCVSMSCFLVSDFWPIHLFFWCLVSCIPVFILCAFPLLILWYATSYKVLHSSVLFLEVSLIWRQNTFLQSLWTHGKAALLLRDTLHQFIRDSPSITIISSLTIFPVKVLFIVFSKLNLSRRVANHGLN